jgi:hypothetical protein
LNARFLVPFSYLFLYAMAFVFRKVVVRPFALVKCGRHALYFSQFCNGCSNSCIEQHAKPMCHGIVVHVELRVTGEPTPSGFIDPKLGQ